MTDWNKKLDEAINSGAITSPAMSSEQDKLKNSLSLGVKVDPNAAAEVSTLSSSTGLPSDLVERNKDQIKSDNKYMSLDIDSILKETPTTAEFLSDPENAKQAHDDIENLQEVERGFLGSVANLAKGMGSSVMRIEGGLRRMTFATIDPIADYIERYVPFAPALFGENYDRDSAYAGFDNFVGATDNQTFGYEEGTSWDSVKDDPIANVIPFMIETGVVSIPDMVVAGLNPWLYGASMTGQVGQARAENDLREDATIEDMIRSLPTAASMALLERFGAHGVMGVDSVVTSLKDVPAEAAKGFLKEGLTELPQEMIQSTGETVGTVRGFDLAETVDQGLAGFVGGAGFGGMAAGARATTEALVNRQVKSGTDALKVDKILTSLENSELNKRNEGAISAFLEKLGARGGDDSLYVDAAGADLLFQSINNPEIRDTETFQRILEQIPNSLESGNPIKIPVSDIPALVNNGLARSLQPHLTTKVDALTPAQMQNVDVKKEIESIKQMDAEQRQADLEVYNDVYGQLTGLGWEQSTSEQYATMYEAFFRTQAKRTGADPMELYEEFGLKISKEIDPALKQRVGRISEFDVLLDRLRDGAVPQDSEIFGRSVMQEIMERGGLLDDGGEISALDADDGKVGRNRIVRPDGRSLDDMAEQLFESGFIPERSEQAVIDAIANELRGQPAYQVGAENEQLLNDQTQLNELEEILGQAGLDVQSMSNEEIKKAMNIGSDGDVLRQDNLDESINGGVSASEFVSLAQEAMKENKNASSMDIFDESEYEKYSLFTMDEGKIGFAIQPDGLLVSVFKNPESKVSGAMGKIMPVAIANGATKLEAFEGFLTQQYNEYGFQETGRVEWSDEFKPEGWPESAGTPDVIIMEISDEAAKQQIEKHSATIEETIQDLRGVRRGNGLLAQKNEESGPEGRESDGSLKGLPRVSDAKHSEKIGEVAKKYVELSGLEYNPPNEYAVVDPERAKRIAQAYDDMEHAPQDPEVLAAYEAMIEETIAQFEVALENGLEVEFINYEEQGDPYAQSPRLAIQDIVENNHMWVFSTKDGFGSDDNFDPLDNPLLRETDFIISGQRALANDIFRVVHDYFGHAKEGVGFRANGEENAWRAHSVMYSPLARKAMTSETRGQNSWVNFGPHGESNRTASAADTHYADQKVGLLPDWAVTEGAGDSDITILKQDQITPERNDIGLYSGVEKAIIDLNLPAWKKKKGGKNKIYTDEMMARRTEVKAALQRRLDEHMETGNSHGETDPAAFAEWDELNELDKARRNQEHENNVAPKANGADIWAKLKKESGVKKEELEWLGIEEFLTVADNKFTRQDVVDFVRQSGVKVEKTEAAEAAEIEMDWGYRQAVSSYSAPEIYDSLVEAEVDDLLNYFNYPSVIPDLSWFDSKGWIRDNFTTIMNYYKKNLDPSEPIGDILRGLRTAFDESVEALADYTEAELNSDLYVAMSDFMQEDARQDATNEARKSLLEDPVYVQSQDNGELHIIGNDDIGYEVTHNLRAPVHPINQHDIWSLNEAEIFAQDIDRQFRDEEEGDFERAKWESYVTDGDYTDYREIKIKLPEINPSFEYDVHFDDPNIVTFLRVTDRELPVTPSNDVGEVEVRKGDYGWDIHEVESGEPMGFSRFSTEAEARAALESGDYEKKTEAGEDQSSYFIEEFQSDWHQQGRQKGYSTGRDLTVEREQKKELTDKLRSIAGEMLTIADTLLQGPEFIDSNYSSRVPISRWAKNPPFNGAFGEGFLGEVYAAVAPIKNKTENPELVSLFADYESTVDQLTPINDAIRLEEKGVTDAPFKGNGWLSLGLKAAIVDAVENDYDSISWVNAAVLTERWSDEYADLYEMQYDTKMPSMMKKLTGVEPVMLDFDGNRMKTIGDIKKEYEIVKLEDGSFSVNHKNGERASTVHETKSDAESRLNLIASFEADSTGSEGYWTIPITDKLKDKIKKDSLPLFQKGKSTTRGFYNTKTNEITFTKNANLSTFLHESGHFFLEVMRELSDRSPEIKSDLDKINSWFDSQGLDTDVKRHEAFASGFESYLREGRAPTQELQSLFNRFRAWLVHIYDSAKKVFGSNNLGGVELSEEVRGVMDRMLAAQEEIDKQDVGNYGSLPIEELGLSAKEAKDYQKLVAEASDEAAAKLTADVMGELERETKKWWKEGISEFKKQIEAELDAMPAYQARAYLSGDAIPERLEALKLNRKYLTENYGKTSASKLGRMSDNSGVHPDVVAVLFNYPSGDALVRDLLGTLNKADKKKYIQAQAEAEMKATHGDVLNDGTISQRAERAMHDDKQAEKIAAELNMINKKLDKNFAIKGTNKNIRPLYKAAAEELMETTPVDEIKPNLHLRSEQKFGREAVKFAAQGKWNEARAAKHKQLRQFYLFKAASNALKSADKHRARLSQMAKTKYSARKVHPNYIQQLKLLVAAYDLRKTPKDSEAILFRVNRFIAAQKETNPDLVASDLLDTIQSWRGMTLNDLKTLRDSAENILTIGKKNSEEQREAFLEVVNDIVRHTEGKAGKTKALPLQNTPSKGIRSFLRGFTASHRKFESILRQADGWEDFAPLQENIMRPLIEATNREIEMKAKAHDDLNELFKGYENLFNPISQRNDTVEVGAIGKMTRGDRIVLALNWGNSGNRDALINMQGYPLTDKDIEAAIATLSDSDLDLVEKIWEYVDTYYDDLAKTEQEATGIAPAKVEAEPFMVNGREMRGGYYPLQGDSLVSAKQNEHDIEKRAERMLAGGGAARASSKHGSAIERKGWGGQPVNLSINGLFQHIDGVIHDITHRKPVMQADRILQHPEVKEVMQNAVGLEHTKEVRNKLVEIAAGYVHPSELTGFAKILRHTRLGLTYNVMGYSIRTALVNITGAASSVTAVGKTRMATASMEFLASPNKKSEFITSVSPFMMNRSETVTRDINDIMRNMQGNGALNKLRANAFIGITKVDALVSRITWLAAYNKALEESRTEADAVYQADRTVSRTQGSGLLIDQSSIESKNEFVKTFTVMYSYFNAQLNLLVEQSGKAKLGTMSKARFIENIIWIMLVPALLEEWMMGEEDDDDVTLADNRWTKAAASYNLSYWAGIRETSGLVKYGMSSQTPLSSAIKNAYDFGLQAEQGEVDKALVRAGLSTISTTFHIPSGVQLTRSVGYLMDLEENGGTINPYGLFVTGKQHND